MPRCGIATISPNGVTRFCNGIPASIVFLLFRPGGSSLRAGGFLGLFRRIIGHGAMRTEQLRREGLGAMLRVKHPEKRYA